MDMKDAIKEQLALNEKVEAKRNEPPKLRVSSWLWDYEQEDIALLQKLYKQLGHDLTKEQCYEIWYTYSEACCANWLRVYDDVDDLKNTFHWGIFKKFTEE